MRTGHNTGTVVVAAVSLVVNGLLGAQKHDGQGLLKGTAAFGWLRGAFDTRRVRMHLPVLDHFGAPVSMDAEAPGDPGAHVAWYSGVQPPEPMRAVTTDWKLA